MQITQLEGIDYLLFPPPAEKAQTHEQDRWVQDSVPFFDPRIADAWRLYCSPIIDDDGVQTSFVSQRSERQRFICSPQYVAHLNRGADKAVGILWIDDLIRPVNKRGDTAHIHVRVHNDYRGRGIGSGLVALFLESHPGEYEFAQCVWLDRGAKDDPIHLFRRHGFEIGEMYGLNAATIDLKR